MIHLIRNHQLSNFSQFTFLNLCKFEDKINGISICQINPIQDGTAHGRGRGTKRPPSLKSVTHILH